MDDLKKGSGCTYPIFTVFDIEKIIKWRNTIKLSKAPNVRRDAEDFL